MNRFSVCLPRILKHEGGYVDHPKDPGGATNKGITHRTYRTYRRMKGLPVQHVKFITEQEVADIYKDSYWDACRCGEMTYGIDYMTFDPAVNSGPRRGIKWMQRALRVKADGVVGPKTLAAIADLSPEEEIAVIDRAADLRMGFLRSLRHWPTFGKGWTRRVMETEAQAKLDAPLDNDTIASLPRTRPSIWDFIMNLLDTLFNKEDLVS